jgi:hypothetical protein
MRFIDNILRRKQPMTPIELVTPVTPEPARDELADLQMSITMHQGRLSAMESEGDKLSSQLSRIAALSSQLKVRCSEHDAGAAEQLDLLEREQRTIERQKEGLALRIAALQAELAPMTRGAVTLARQRDEQRQDQVVSEIALERDRLTSEILESWERACASAYDLASLLDPGRAGEIRLDKEHATALLRMASEMGGALQVASLQHVNDPSAFEIRHSQWFRALQIQPLRRKAKRALAG